MESLLCDEVWVMSPNEDEGKHDRSVLADNNVVEMYNKQDFEEAFGILLEKEASYMPEPGYANHVKFNGLINDARYKAVYWLIGCQRRFNLSFESVFDAVNYLDRFISLKKCQEWKEWMFELLSVACLLVATKFNEIDPPPLHEMQMGGFENFFESKLIQRMELTVLEASGWRLSSTTPYSYLHLLTWNTGSFGFKETLPEEELRLHITQMLLGALLDPKFLEFRPCVIAESALKCSLEEFFPSEINNPCFNHFSTLIPQDLENDLEKCQMMMDKGLTIHNVRTCGRIYCPSSPVTVLTTKQCDLFHCQLLDFSHFINLGSSIRKRKRHTHDNLGLISSVGLHNN